MLPFSTAWGHFTADEIDRLSENGDGQTLTSLLGNRDPDVRRRAAAVLETMGPAATKNLVARLTDHRIIVRLGALEALAGIRDPSCTGSVIEVLVHDPDTEVRWAAAIALGQIGDGHSIPTLVRALEDPDKYVRFGAAGALKALGWEPDGPERKAALGIALQDWETVRRTGRPAIPLLIRILSDKDRDVRDNAVELLGDIRAPGIVDACDKALSDGDSRVRWNAVLASKKCGVSMIDLPSYVSRRPRTRPNPYAAAVLNFFFLGLGYNYLGKWWGFLIFMSYMTLMLLFSLEFPSNLPLFNIYPNLYFYPLTAIFAYQTYTMAKKVPDM